MTTPGKSHHRKSAMPDDGTQWLARSATQQRLCRMPLFRESNCEFVDAADPQIALRACKV